MSDFFEVVPKAEAAVIRENPKGANGKWRPVTEALGRGELLRVRIATHMVGAYSRQVNAAYPDKRLASRKTDDPAFRYLWLVDR